MLSVNAVAKINEIISRGNTAEVKIRKGDVIILEVIRRIRETEEKKECM